MEYLIVGYIFRIAGAICVLYAIRFTWGKKIDVKGIIASVCLMANFLLFSNAFITIHRKPEQANLAKNALLNLGVINVIAIVIITIILFFRRKKAR